MMMNCPHCHGAGALQDVELSPHFRLSEFLRSTAAKAQGLSNVPGPAVVESLRLLAVALLQPLRNRFGAILVTSGYRSPEVNAAVGGASTSAHLSGHAADIVPLHASLDEVMAYLPESGLAWDQAIHEGSHLHISRISRRGEQRRQLLRLHVGGSDAA